MSDFRRAAAVRVLPALGLAAALAACGDAGAQEMRSLTSARQLQGERRVEVEVRYGAGRLKVEPAAGDLLYRMEVRYDESRFRPVTSYDRSSGRLRLGLESEDSRRGRGASRVDGSQRATVALSPRVATRLDLEFGAGEADVELGGLALEEVEISTGASETRVSFARPNRVAARVVRLEAGAAALKVEKLGNARAERFEFEGGLGETTLDFSGEWGASATASIQMGVGSVTLRLPRGVGVRIRKDSFLASFDAPGMVRRGGAWYSRDYEGARHKLDIEIDAAIGSVDIDWVD